MRKIDFFFAFDKPHMKLRELTPEKSVCHRGSWPLINLRFIKIAFGYCFGNILDLDFSQMSRVKPLSLLTLSATLHHNIIPGKQEAIWCREFPLGFYFSKLRYLYYIYLWTFKCLRQKASEPLSQMTSNFVGYLIRCGKMHIYKRKCEVSEVFLCLKSYCFLI